MIQACDKAKETRRSDNEQYQILRKLRGKPYLLKDFPRRFYSKVSICSISGCWNWIAGKANCASYGVAYYGKFKADCKDPKSTSYAHRFSYIHIFGQVPQGLELDHVCHNKLCVNPSHLQAITHAENCARRPRSGRIPNRMKGLMTTLLSLSVGLVGGSAIAAPRLINAHAPVQNAERHPNYSNRAKAQLVRQFTQDSTVASGEAAGETPDDLFHTFSSGHEVEGRDCQDTTTPPESSNSDNTQEFITSHLSGASVSQSNRTDTATIPTNSGKPTNSQNVGGVAEHAGHDESLPPIEVVRRIMPRLRLLKRVIERKPILFYPRPRQEPNYHVIYWREMLECGHTEEHGFPDPAIARRRECKKCTEAASAKEIA